MQRVRRTLLKTLQEQCLWARLYDDVEDLRQAVIEFTRRYNEWLSTVIAHRGRL